MNEELETWVDTLPSNGEWWHSDGRDRFLAAARRLLDVGVPFDVVTSVLESAYYAVAGEFGG